MSGSEYEGPVIGVVKPGPTWGEIWAAVGAEVWKLAPQDYQDSGHRDLTFLVCWQNVMEAVENGLATVAEQYAPED